MIFGSPDGGHVRLEVAPDGAATLTLCNPARKNAINSAMWRGIAAALAEIEADRAIRTVLLRGDGEIAFSSGADISEFGDMRSAPDATKAYNADVAAAFVALDRCTKPLVALIHGICMGAGVAIAGYCDLRLVGEDARIAIPAGKLGVAYDPNWVKRLIDISNPEFVSELLLTAREFTGPEAVQRGFAGTLRPKTDLDAYAAELAARIAANAPLTLKASKVTIREALAFDSARDWTSPFALADACDRSEDYKNAVAAFAARRKPVFKGE